MGYKLVQTCICYQQFQARLHRIFTRVPEFWKSWTLQRPLYRDHDTNISEDGPPHINEIGPQPAY
ncbi:hypothetical protein HUJ04_001458 [Dendroctonus ponderosae]|nr:hypothetical protein HUJ04_001458 [Dendroctonus ponderosae]